MITSSGLSMPNSCLSLIFLFSFMICFLFLPKVLKHSPIHSAYYIHKTSQTSSSPWVSLFPDHRLLLVASQIPHLMNLCLSHLHQLPSPHLWKKYPQCTQRLTKTLQLNACYSKYNSGWLFQLPSLILLLPWLKKVVDFGPPLPQISGKSNKVTKNPA